MLQRQIKNFRPRETFCIPLPVCFFFLVSQSPNLDHRAIVRLFRINLGCWYIELRQGFQLTVISTRQHHPSANHARDNLPLAASGPDVLEVAVALGKAVEGVVALAAGTDETAEGVGLVLAGVAAVLVNLADGDLDRGVVVGLDDAVGGAALAGHVAVGEMLVSVQFRCFHDPLLYHSVF